MNTTIMVQSLLGGTLIGAAAVMLMFTLGRISGVSGITSGLLSFNINKDDFWRIAFVLGLISGPLLFGALGGEVPEIVVDTRLPYLIVGGLLVGFGSTLGSGCASGHGVCGIARISPRSLLATAIFVIAAIATVFFTRG